MGRVAKIARRTFLVGTAAIAGGVAFGYYAYRKPHENPLLADLAEDEVTLNPYVLIDQSGVTLITPRADVGQGVYSVLAALLAEELEIDWQDIRVDHGPPSSAYFNGALGEDLFPVAATDESVSAHTLRGLGKAAVKLMGLQGTGGSSSVPDAYDKMRLAGATARETLLLAAQQKTGVPKATLRARSGTVHLPDGTSLTYSELAPIAATLEPPGKVKLKPQSEWRYLGQKTNRIDIVPKSTGTAIYGLDLQLESMVHATVRANPGIGGTVESFNAERALAMRGVEGVYEITSGVAVVADNTWRAFKAAEALEISWGPAPYPLSSEEHWQTLENSFTSKQQDSRFKDEGNVETAFASGGVIKAEYRIPYLAHAPLEPMTAMVLLDGDRLDIWTGTQIPQFVVTSAAKITGLPEENIHLHVEMSGGSFGRKLEDDYVRQAVEIATHVKGRPVKLTWSREEDMTHDFPRPIGMARGEGTVGYGEVESFDLSVAGPSAVSSQAERLGYALPGPDRQIVAGAFDQPFRIPHYRVTGYRPKGLAPVSSWRSVGASGNGFFHESFMDEMIHAAGADPLQARINMCWHGPSREVLKAVGEMSNWASEIGEGRGRGIAFTLSFGVPVAEVVEVTNTPQGIRIDKVFVAADVGKILDPVNFEAQMFGAVIWGLGHAMNAELTLRDGHWQQTNFHAFEGMRLYQCPEIIVQGLENADEIRGIGEPGVPPAAPALANAIFAATGQRIRELPLNKHIDFV